MVEINIEKEFCKYCRHEKPCPNDCEKNFDFLSNKFPKVIKKITTYEYTYTPDKRKQKKKIVTEEIFVDLHEIEALKKIFDKFLKLLPDSIL